MDNDAPLSGAMTAPNISSDYKKITVRQVVYNNGIHESSVTLRIGQSLVTDGFWEPEWMFSDGDSVYVHVGINKSPNRKELIYKIA